MYKQKLWYYMYDNCFGNIGMLVLALCDEYLVQDIKKLIINSILIVERWNNLGFMCE